MVGPGHEFDDSMEEEPTGPLLPPEDRLWRHPSEMAAEGRTFAEQVLDARSRWLSSTPTRAGAWSAGIIGAVLATGVVLIGTHLTAWLKQPAPSTKRAVTVDLPMFATTTSLASMVADNVQPRTAVEKIGRNVATGMAVVEGWTSAGAHVVADGLVVTSDGMIAVPASVTGDSGLQVTLPSGQFPATVVGVDPMSETAIIHVNVTGLHPLPLESSSSLAPGQWMGIEWLDTNEIVVSVGAVKSLFARTEPANGLPALFTGVTASATGLSSEPSGAVVIDYAGQVTGLVTCWRGDELFEIAGPTLMHIADELIADGHVVHGWLGIEGRHVSLRDGMVMTTPMGDKAKLEAGVAVTAVDPRSAAERFGIRKGDVLESIDGLRVTTVAQLQAALYLMVPGERVHVTLERAGRQLRKTVALSAAA